jgi:hypothetical protein
MTTITINVSDELKTEAEEAARSVNLSLTEFAQLALTQSLARTLKDPRREQRTKYATGDGWERLKQYHSCPKQRFEKLNEEPRWREDGGDENFNFLTGGSPIRDSLAVSSASC